MLGQGQKSLGAAVRAQAEKGGAVILHEGLELLLVHASHAFVLPGGMLAEMEVCEGLELLESHVRLPLFKGHHGVYLGQAEVQPVRQGGDGLVDGQVGLGIQFVVIICNFEEIGLLAQRVLHGKQGLAAQIAVLGKLDHPGSLATGEVEGEAGQHLLRVVRIVGLPFVQEGFHAQSGRPHPVHQVIVAAQVFLLRERFLGRGA